METFSALLTNCAGNSPVPGEFPAQRPVTRSFDVFFDLHPSKRSSKQWWGWWFETPSCPLWCHLNGQQVDPGSGDGLSPIVVFSLIFSLNLSSLIFWKQHFQNRGYKRAFLNSFEQHKLTRLTLLIRCVMPLIIQRYLKVLKYGYWHHSYLRSEQDNWGPFY